MLSRLAVVAALIPLVIAADEPENPWTRKVGPAVERAQRDRTPAALETALDAAWRGDDWPAGLRVARLALETHPDEPALQGLIVRALWRAGQIAEAERIALRIPAETRDRIATRARLTIHLARSERPDAERWLRHLEALGPQTAEDYYHVFEAEFALRRTGRLSELLRQTELRLDPRNGYPEYFISESIEGLVDYLERVGPEPLNKIAAFGSAAMTPLPLLAMPCCDVLINGRGPYRLVIDTGGSLMIAIDDAVAEEIGLKSLGTAPVRGVSGKEQTEQALVDELRVGTIVCHRVLTRVFGIRAAVMNAADGIIGTGIFGDGRMTLDFLNTQMTVAPSQPEPAPGVPIDLRLVGDFKLLALVELETKPAIAMLDSGADMVVLSPAWLKRAFPDRPVRLFNPGIGLGVGSEEAPQLALTPGVHLVFAGRTYDNYSGLGLDTLDTVLSPLLGVQMDILLGMPVFRETKTCTVDFPTGRMWVDWLRTPSPSEGR